MSLVLVVLAGLCWASRAHADVYWSNAYGDGSTIGRAAPDGGGVEQSFVSVSLQSSPGYPAGLAVDASYIYWANSRGSIGRAGIDGSGANQDFIDLPFALGLTPEGIAVDRQYIYWTDPSANAIGRANLDGTGVNTSFISTGSPAMGLALDGQHIYWTNTNSYTVGRASIDGSDVLQTFIAGSSVQAPWGIAVDSRYVYWANGANGTIARAALDGTGAATLITDAGRDVTGVAVDALHIYWGLDDSAGEDIDRANLDGSSPTGFIATNNEPDGIAVDRPTAPPPPVNTQPPTIAGTAQDGQWLYRTDKGSWTSADPLTFTYQWQRCDSLDAGCIDIPHATGIFYRLTSADVGHQITLEVTATDLEGQTGQATAAPLGPVANPPPPVNTARPRLAGTAAVGRWLVRTYRGGWRSPDALAFAYQWQRCDSLGANCTNITGQTGFAYRLTAFDLGYQITLLVTATDREGQAGQAVAIPMGPVTG